VINDDDDGDGDENDDDAEDNDDGDDDMIIEMNRSHPHLAPVYSFRAYSLRFQTLAYLY